MDPSGSKRKLSEVDSPTEGRSGTSQRQGIPGDFVTDDLDDATHQSLDEQVLRDCEGFALHNKPLHIMAAMCLLTALAKCDRLDPKYQDFGTAKRVIENNPRLMALLQDSCEKKSFKEIRTFGLLRVMKPIETPTQQAERLDKMFHQTYRGDAVEGFVHALSIYSKIYNPYQHFGRCISILQSSGTGKSRLIQELGHKILTLSICFRESESPRAGWPPNDAPARRFLSDVKHQGEELAAAFLGALLDVVTTKLTPRIGSGLSPKAMMSDWALATPADVTNSPRYRCFAEVEDAANQRLSRSVEDLKRMQTSASSVAQWHMSLFKHFCSAPATKLAQVLKQLSQEYFVLAFDECSQLGMSLLIALMRIIKASDRFDLKGVTIWYLLLDTTSPIFNMVPQGPNSRSARLTRELVMLPPWSYLGFNQMVEARHTANIQKPTDVLSLEFLKAYGRPYWSTLANEQVLGAALEKLFNAHFRPKSEDHVFAALALRIGLELGECEASTRLATDAVRSHMRILIGVAGQLVITSSPSEPMLAIAAATALNASAETYQNAIETLLDKLILRGFVLDRGLQGELYTRLLLTLARDKALLPHGGEFVENGLDEVPRVRPVRLSQFLTTLLGKNLGIPDRDAAQWELLTALLEDMSEVWINFTHFVRLSTPISEVTPSMLLEAWSLGFAFQCAFNQPVIDGFIVAYFGKLDEPFDRLKLFLIPWQTKAKDSAASKALASQLAAPFLVDAHIRTKPLHVVILMDLAASASLRPQCELTVGSAVRPPGKRGNWNGYANANEVEGKRYCINIRGHGSQNYPVLKGFEMQFDQLFQRSLLGAGPDFVPFVQAMEKAMDRIKQPD